MRNSLRLSIGTFAMAALAACSHSSEQPTLSDDLKQDLAKAGGGDVQLAGAGMPKLDFVSASERTTSPSPAPKAPAVTKAPTAARGTKAVVKSVRHEAPAAAPQTTRAADIAPAEVLAAPPVPEPVPAQQSRPQAPRPSTQREPPGGLAHAGSSDSQRAVSHQPVATVVILSPSVPVRGTEAGFWVEGICNQTNFGVLNPAVSSPTQLTAHGPRNQLR